VGSTLLRGKLPDHTTTNPFTNSRLLTHLGRYTCWAKRYGLAPLGEYSKHVGSRTDVVISRTGTRMTAEYAYHTEIKFYIMPKPAELDRDHQCHPLNAATETRQVRKSEGEELPSRRRGTNQQAQPARARS
jgi:hypothetical protein